MLVVNWLRGRWRVLAAGLKQRCAALLNKDFKYAGDIGAPAAGMDIWTHIMREHNWEADALTHLAREEGDTCEFYDAEDQVDVVWGSFDGGKDEQATATGRTIWTGKLREGPRGGWHQDADFEWQRAARGGHRCLNGETATSVELAAAEALYDALERVLAAIRARNSRSSRRGGDIAMRTQCRSHFR